MGIMAPIEDGKVVETASQSSLSSALKKSDDGMDKDAFLQLLVAQMKYQDPLEPTSNTEYISQYAQFSQVEQLQNMSASMDLQRASQLVGKEVYIRTTGSDGESRYVQGKVDYVVYENGKAYLSIGESLYSLDDLDTVADSEYLTAYNLALDWVTALNKLPALKNIGLEDGETIDKLKQIYDEMTDYQKSFIASDKVKTMEEYVSRLEALRAAAKKDEVEEEVDGDEGVDTDKDVDSDEDVDTEGSGNGGAAGGTEGTDNVEE